MKRTFSEIIKILPFVLAAALLFSACSRFGAKLEVIFSPFECEISRRFNGDVICAIVSVGELSEGKRNVSIRFSSPEPLAGLTVSRAGGMQSLELNGVALGEPPYEYLRLLDILAPTMAFEYIGKSGSMLCYRNSGSRWYFSDESGMPVMIEYEDIKIEITRIGKNNNEDTASDR